MPTSVSKSALKSKMLEYFREVERTGVALVVTSHGRPVLKVVRIAAPESPSQVFADVRGRVILPDDDEMTSPLAADAWADSELRDLLS